MAELQSFSGRIDKIPRGHFLALSRSSQGAYLRHFGEVAPSKPDPSSIELEIRDIDGLWTADEIPELRRAVQKLEMALIDLESRWYKEVEQDLMTMLALFASCGTEEF
jgi:hypothetical protein